VNLILTILVPILLIAIPICYTWLCSVILALLKEIDMVLVLERNACLGLPRI
jgi:hypothetical protein